VWLLLSRKGSWSFLLALLYAVWLLLSREESWSFLLALLYAVWLLLSRKESWSFLLALLYAVWLLLSREVSWSFLLALLYAVWPLLYPREQSIWSGRLRLFAVKWYNAFSSLKACFLFYLIFQTSLKIFLQHGSQLIVYSTKAITLSVAYRVNLIKQPYWNKEQSWVTLCHSYTIHI
jgi:hypothetical protein